MNIWIVGVGEPLPIDGELTRLRRVGNLATYISSTRNNVHWFSVSFDHYQKKQRVEADKSFRINDNFLLHVAYVPGYEKNVSVQRIIHHKKAAKNIKKMMESEEIPDVILAGNTPLEVIGMVVEYGKRHNVPVIMDIRDLWPEIFLEAVSNKMKSFIKPYVWICRNSLKKTTKDVYSLIGLSKGFLEYGLLLANRPKTDIDRVIPIGYPDYKYNISKETFSNYWGKYGLNPDDFIIAFTGNFGRQFDFESIVVASKLLENQNKIKFVLCGTGENLNKVKGKTGNNVIFPGWIEKNMITSLLQYSSLGIAPYINSFNYRSNTPNKFGEYLSASLPILVSVQGSMEDLLKENNCGYHYSSGEELSKLILSYYSDANTLTLQQKNARNLYESNFNGSKSTENLYNHIVNVVDSFKKTHKY